MEVLKHASPTRVPLAPNDSPSKIRPSSRARIARMLAQCAAYRGIFKCSVSRLLLLLLLVAFRLRLQSGGEDKKARAAFAARASKDTPQMPFRWISRSLSVTGGRPSRARLTSN